ncbi:MAG: hypothetical protein LBI96_07755, partial [Odoribacteraceae bacterium]|nr:hypothetical protein [Odoribacteraceae bacterium]
KEIRVAKPKKMFILEIDFGQSLNRPLKAWFSCEEESASDDASLDSARDIDSTAFAPPPAGTIIVDNRDEGFRVIEPLSRIERFKSRKESAPDARPNLNRWHESMEAAAYGDGIKSKHVKYSGTGKSRVEWTATIPDEGAYDLHVFSSYQVPFPFYHLKEVIYHYTVSTPGEPPVEIPLQLYKAGERWVHLGRFHVTPGTCTVSLGDRSETPPEFIAAYLDGLPPEVRARSSNFGRVSEVHADAIRWTRVNIP